MTLLLIFISTYCLVSQIPTNCVEKTIRTNPNGSPCGVLDDTDTTAYNNERPYFENCQGFLLNWTEGEYNSNENIDTRWPVYSAKMPGQPYYIESCFFKGGNTLTNHFTDSKDMYSSDGWELIIHNFGTESVYEDNPYYVLYNRFTGILRVLIAIGNADPQQNGISFKIIFEKEDLRNYSSVLGDYSVEVPLRSVEDTCDTEGLFAVTEFLQSTGKWFYADFNMIYDPCTCLAELDYTRINIKVKLIQNSQIEILGDLEATITDIINGSGGVDDQSDGMLSFPSIESAAKKATESYTAGDNLVGKLMRNYDALESNGKVTFDFANIAKTSIETFVKNVSEPSLFNSLLSLAGPAFAAFSVIDFFVSGGGRDNTTHPMQVLGNLTLSGTLFTETPYTDITFSLPGSYNISEQDQFYPYYNQILGIFNLLETPKIDEYKNRKTWDCSAGLCKHRDTLKYKLKLGDDFKYVVNPAAGFKMMMDQNNEDIKILGALVFEFDEDSNYGREYSLYYNNLWEVQENIFQTRFLPIQCLDNISIVLFTNQYIASPNPVNYYEPSIIYLKLLVQLEVDDDIARQPVIFSGKYRLNEIECTNQNQGYWLSEWNYPVNLTIEGDRLNGPTTLDQTNYGAWEYATLNYGVNDDPNMFHTIKAGYEIKLKSTYPSPPNRIVFDDNTHLKLDLPRGCSEDPIPPATSSEIYNVCIGSTYNANHTFTGLLAGTKYDSYYTENKFSLNISPNPADSELKLIIRSAQSDILKIVIVSNLGIPLYATTKYFNKGHEYFSVLLEDFAPGVYFLRVSLGGQVETRKFVVVR